MQEVDVFAAVPEEYRQLLAEHSALESRLTALGRRPFLSAAQQLECTDLKKRKLRCKDRMEALARGASMLRPA